MSSRGSVTTVTAAKRSPAIEVLADANVRHYFVAQILFASVNGTLRFAFVWLMVTLTRWEGAEGLIAVMFGLPAMVLSLPAGAWSDRLDRRRMFLICTSLAAAVMAAFSIVIWVGLASSLVAGVAAVMIGTIVTINMPNMTSIMPLLVPPERLMNAVALQNGAAQAANFMGLVVAGVAIARLGDGAGFALLSLMALASVTMMWRVRLPARPVDPEAKAVSLARSILDGARFGYGSDPLRTLLIVSTFLGGSFAVVQISLPRVVESVYGGQASKAGLVLSIFGIGMLLGSLVVSGRTNLPHGRMLVVMVGVGLGLGQILVGLAPSYWVALLVMFSWGVSAGLAMVSHRTLLQTNTPPAMMGRVMGLMNLGFAGSLPIGAMVQSFLAPAVGAQRTMVIVGSVTMAVTFPLLARPAIRRL